VKISAFDYELPAERIAQHPAEPRDAARLFAHAIDADASEHALVRDLPRFLRRGDLLVVNDTRVRPARLCGRRASGGAIELLVLGPAPAPNCWRAFVKPAKRLKPGETFTLEDGAVAARALERPAGESGAPGQEWWIELRDGSGAGRAIADVLEASGRMPLPPYIERAAEGDGDRALDRERYQTVFARATGAIAAPTAGLHFTPALLAALAEQGVERATLTLHVGVGTFQPVAVDELAEHRMHSEEFELPQATVDAIARTRACGGRVVAVGTTTVRVLESCARADGSVVARRGETSIFLVPGHEFRAVDVLLTNFHLPRSTLLVLVSAFAGRERILRLYAEALAERYRFFSYGDAMLLARGR
jgi:S-adenosylmethionine:tRNA ribosyltransferase-isomerase